MNNYKIVLNTYIVAFLLFFAFAGHAWSQDQQSNQRPPRDSDQRRQMSSDSLRETLKFSEEEWQVIEPRVQKVMVLSIQSSGVGGRKGRPMGAFGKQPSKGMDVEGRAGGPSGKTARDEPGDRQRPQREQTELGLLLQDLNSVLQDEEAATSQIKEKLAAVRSAREESKLELARAQAELKELLTIRQEAILVMMGLLN